MKPLLLIASLACWLLTLAASQAQALLSPPFGLKWGDTPEKLFDWAERHKLDVTLSLPGHQIDERHVIISNSKGNLPSHQASSLEARFNKGKLYEVTLNFADPKMSFDLAELRFSEAKRALTAQHGQFKLTKKKRNTDKDNFTTDSISYHIEPVSGLFLMITKTEVRDGLRNQRRSTFSIIYHNDNVIQR
ncbi:hypothetical protein [Rubritalea tangerina]|uniref:Uncharacterized protein n=1 Tax=Rubritalea tangerina TaxID=430798 RepID=A0ABW4ZF40_9BACT